MQGYQELKSLTSKVNSCIGWLVTSIVIDYLVSYGTYLNNVVVYKGDWIGRNIVYCDFPFVFVVHDVAQLYLAADISYMVFGFYRHSDK